jgi:hypothetical protein
LNIIGQGWPYAGTNGSELFLLEALTRYVPSETIDRVLTKTGRHSRRVRKAPAGAMVWLVIAMGLWGDLNIPSLWRQVVGTLASLWMAAAARKPPGKSALIGARSRLGARPLRQLFLETAGPIAAANTKGARYKGMAMKAMDGQDYLIPDTPVNAKAFGKPSTARGGKRIVGAYPQIHVNRLIEVGTRMTIEAVIKPQDHNEHPTAPHLLECCQRGDLAMWDCGFYSYKLIKQAMEQGTFMLGPVPSHVVLDRVRTLSDGSYLARIHPDSSDRKRNRNGVIVRIIEYTFDDPARPGHGERHRLITTLLDAGLYPAGELVVLYHQRWEIEIANDEIVTHQLARRVDLRSQTPVGVVQEMYGVLLAHNAIRALMHEAAVSIDVDPRTLSFIHAVRVVRETIPLMRAAPTNALPVLYKAMIAKIAEEILPPRDNRINPRVIKVKMSNWPKKREQHYNVPQPKKLFEDSIVLLN